MTELGDIFLELGLGQYLDVFVEHGFDTWDTILDITESDFDALGVKLGHRRKLQRRIANSRGLSSDQALISPTRNTPVDDRQSEEQRNAISKTEGRDGAQNSGKRKYRRHPKPDENAPERPPSAYVIFSNKMRVDLKGRNLSFTEIAKLVGENWQNLSPSEKEPYEAQAFIAKEKYNAELADYKRTENYRKYAEYLLDFKEKQANLQNAVTDPSKRPKLDHQISTGSSAAGSSAESQHGVDGVPIPGRGGSAGSGGTSRMSSIGNPSPSNKSFSLSMIATSQSGTVKPKEQSSPTSTQSTILPGYRESLVGTQQHTLAWRDSTRAMDASSPPLHSRITNTNDRRSRQPPASNVDSSSHFGMRPQNDYQAGSSFSPPPLLTSESTAGTSMSSASNSSSLHHMPRTPLEPSLDRQSSMSALYSIKLQDNQLPPLRSISLSPQSSINVSYNSPSGIVAMDYTQAPLPRAYLPVSQAIGPSGLASHPSRTIPPHINTEEEILDPVSALLRADEIVNRSSRNRPSS